MLVHGYKNIMRKFAKPIYESCISSEKLEKLRFKDRLLTVEPGVEPELMNRENYGVPVYEKIIRQLIYAVWVTLTLYGCFMLIFYFETIIADYEIAAPEIVCKDGITGIMAEIDYSKKMYYRNGDFNCYCKKLLADSGSSIMNEFAFPVSGEKKCSEYEQAVWNLAVLPLLIGIIMGIINNVTE
jgi:hypothetical protein